MKKSLSWLLGILGLLVMALLVGGYFYGRTKLKEVPKRVQDALREKNLLLTFRDSEIGPLGLSLNLNDVSIQGIGGSWPVRMERIHFQFGLAPSWPPLKLSIETHADLRSVGVDSLDIRLLLRAFSFSGTTLSRMRIDHRLSARGIKNLPPAAEIKIFGASQLTDLNLDILDCVLVLGDTAVPLYGNLDLATRFWKIKGDLSSKNGPLRIKIPNREELKFTDVAGEFYLTGDALTAQKVKFALPNIQGNLDIDWHFNRKPNLAINIKTKNADANALLTLISLNSANLLSGKLDSQTDLRFSGFTESEIKESVSGKGDFLLRDAQLKTIKFSKKLSEVLSHNPVLSAIIRTPEIAEKLNSVKGDFTVSAGKLIFSETVLESLQFEAVAESLAISFDQIIDAKIDWIPKENLIAGTMLNPIRDEKGKPKIPVKVSGLLRSPKIEVQTAVLENRVKKYFSFSLPDKKSLENAKNKIQEEIEKQLKSGPLKKFFK